MKNMDRRQFLQAAINSGLAFSLSSLVPNSVLAQQEPGAEKLLLVLRFNGAWDSLMAMDARTKEFLNAASFSTSEFLAFDDRTAIKQYKEAQLGISMKPLFEYLDDICIVNGVMMNMKSSAHETNREYMSSGNLTTGTTFFPFALAQAIQRPDYRIGYHMEYETLHDGNYGNIAPTKNLNSFSESVDDPFESVLDDETTAASMQKRVISQKRKDKDTITTLNKMIEMAKTSLSAPTDQIQQASLALAGLGSGYLKMAQVDMTRDGDLDTHFAHQSTHNTKLTQGFDHVAKMIKFMKETPYRLDPSSQKTLFDMITVVVTSEFARTAYPESGSGTAHNQYTNSCLLFGGNVNGGTLIGSSYIYKKAELNNPNYEMSNGLYHATPFNFHTQKPMTKEEHAATTVETFGTCKGNKCYDYIYPETIWRTVAQDFGANTVSTFATGPTLKNMFK
ncbi:MAG: DUF1501 domain-containing protein [Bdellovibrionaceae bacterium]|nr:DUF1501 domain-containing protein [Pseudobdellovibrionaceae bacterium]